MEAYINDNFLLLSDKNKIIINDENVKYKAYFIACIMEKNVINFKKLIYENEININHLFKLNRTGLMIASAYNDNIQIIEFLINHININNANINGVSPLMYACSLNKIQIIQVLINNGASLKQQNKNGYDYFLLACALNTRLEVIIYLSKIANINIKNNNDENGFLIACQSNENEKIIKYLATKIDINCKTKKNDSCFMVACAYNNVKVVHALSKISINFNDKNYYGNNAFICACLKNNRIDVIEYIIKNAEELSIEISNKINLCVKNYEILKYLHHEIKMDFNENNGFLTACKYVKNIDMFEYIIKHISIDEMMIKNGLNIACARENMNAIEYLINKYRLSEENMDEIFINVCNGYNYNVFKYFVDDLKMDINKLDMTKCNIKNLQIFNYLEDKVYICIKEMDYHNEGELNSYFYNSGYLVFMKNVKKFMNLLNKEQMEIYDCIKKCDNYTKIFNYIIKNELKGDIMLCGKRRFTIEQLIIMHKHGIKTKLFHNNKINAKCIKNCTYEELLLLIKHGIRLKITNKNDNKFDAKIKINGKIYEINKKKLIEECDTLAQLFEYELKNEKEIEINIDEDDIVINEFLYVMHNKRIRNNGMIVELCKMMDKYPLKSITIENVDCILYDEYEEIHLNYYVSLVKRYRVPLLLRRIIGLTKYH